MRMKLFGHLSLCVVLLAIGAGAQEKHAPTLQQCMADLNLWSSEANLEKTGDLDTLRRHLHDLTAMQLLDRVAEMDTCGLAYRYGLGAENVSQINSLSNAYDIELLNRLHHFLVRHDLVGKFHAEDKAGMR